MSKRSIQVQETMCCGIDVSAKSLTVAIQRMHQPVEQRSVPNTSVGHKALIVWLRKAKLPVRVSLEATGIYSLDGSFRIAEDSFRMQTECSRAVSKRSLA